MISKGQAAGTQTQHKTGTKSRINSVRESPSNYKRSDPKDKEFMHSFRKPGTKPAANGEGEKETRTNWNKKQPDKLRPGRHLHYNNRGRLKQPDPQTGGKKRGIYSRRFINPKVSQITKLTNRGHPPRHGGVRKTAEDRERKRSKKRSTRWEKGAGVGSPFTLPTRREWRPRALLNRGAGGGGKSRPYGRATNMKKELGRAGTKKGHSETFRHVPERGKGREGRKTKVGASRGGGEGTGYR